MNCDDRGPDLVAHLLHQLDADEAREFEAHLATCEACRSETARLSAVHAAAVETEQIEPSPAVRAQLLESVRDEASARRSAAERVAAATTDACDGFGAQAVALALGQLDGDDRAGTEDHVAGCTPCQADFRDARRWAEAAGAAVDLAPAPETLQALLRRIAEEPGEPGPEPPEHAIPDPVRRLRGPPRILSWLLPALVAAALVMAVSLSRDDADGAGGALIQNGSAMLHDASAGNGSPRQLDPTHGGFTFAIGDEVRAATSPVEIGVACAEGADPSHASGEEVAGVVRLSLAPGARVRRLDRTHFELRAGQVEVSTGPMDPPFEVRSGDLFARVRGTRFVASVAEERLVVVVQRGKVEIGRRGGESRVLEAGMQGLVDAQRLLSRPADERGPGDAFLTPQARLIGPERVRRGEGVVLEAQLGLGEGGPVTIAGFDPSLPLFVVRLKRQDGPERSVTLVRSMIAGDGGAEASGARTVRLADGAPYRLRFTLPGEDLEPGRWEARLRYTSYRAASQGAEWLGVVESPALAFEVHE